MRAFYGDKVYVAVKTAVEGEIRHLRIYEIVRCVVYVNCYFTFLGKLVGYIDAPGGIAAVVVREVLAASVDVGRGVRTADFKIIFVSCGKLAFLQRFLIDAATAEIVVSAVLPVGCVPGMRQGEKLCPLANGGVGRVFIKAPALVKIKNFSHKISSERSFNFSKDF